MSHKLLFRWGDRREERLLKGSSVRIGRDAGNDVVIDSADRSISRFHARLDHDGQHWRITDTNSTNRVRVNSELIEPGPSGTRVLSDGDTLLLGGFELRFVREESESVVLEAPPELGSSTRKLFAIPKLQDLTGLLAAPGDVALPKEAQEAIEKARKALTVVTSIGRRIAAVTPVDDIIDAIVDLVFEATPAERAALFLWDDDTERLVPKRTRARSAADQAVVVSESLVREAYAQRAVAQIDPEAKPSLSMQSLGLRSAVAVPLMAETRAVGVIYADTPLVEGAFDPFAVALLSALASHTAIALEQTRLLRKARQEERWRARLTQYLAPSVVDRILASKESAPGFSMKVEEVEVTVLFCDMAGFTARTEEMEPHDVFVLLNRCFGHMTEVVQNHGGTVDKYIGDCLMAVFGAPFVQPDHARRAALAALGVREVIGKLNAAGNEVEVGFRMGMHSGRAVAGDVGHVTRRNWTVLGSTVNLASRLESAIAQPGQIVLTGDTRQRLGDEFEVRELEVLKAPKGIKRGFQAFELLRFLG
jgi:adenylate cyclase